MARPSSRSVLLLLTFSLVATLAVAGPQPQSQSLSRDPVRTGTVEKINPTLVELERDYAGARTRRGIAEFEREYGYLHVSEGRVVIDAVAEDDTEEMVADLERLGVSDISAYGRLASGWIAIEDIGKIADLESVRFVRPSYKPLTNVGLVTSQGDVAQRSDLARTLGPDGTGITVGVMSDSYDNLGGAPAGVASGDLPGPGNPVNPTPVNVLLDLGGGGIDEGRGMAEIVHDVAPRANLAFRTAFISEPDFAAGIGALVGVGCDVIVDDIFYFAEPFFQDGVIAQAADAANAAGVAYFSSAGNSARDSYDSAFRDSGGGAHDFDPGAGVDTLQSITIPAGARISMALQWDQPFFSVSGAPGAASDVDLHLFNAAGTVLLASSIDSNIGGDPVEVLVWTNTTGATSFNLLIDLFAGPAPARIKYVIYRNGTINQFDTDSGTCVGHPNAAGAMAVGAARYDRTPAFGTAPPLIEGFSSAGSVPILFNTAGAAVGPIDRFKPQFTAPDGADTTFFGGGDFDFTGFPNFFGTSASAPHAAGVAALMLEQAGGPFSLTTAKMRSVLVASAVDMDDPATGGFDAGFDYGTGAGLIRADFSVVEVTDTDGDGTINFDDPDDDNDGVADGGDSAPLDPRVCRDLDTDGCDDCSQNPVSAASPVPWATYVPNTANDGLDTDGDGQCNVGDMDDDNDGVTDGGDSAPLDPRVCRDLDADTCDDCSQNPSSTASPTPWPPYAPNPADDGPDADGDGACNAGDPDDDNDGVLDGADADPLDPQVCTDDDGDTCDDCSQNPSSTASPTPWPNYSPDIANDGPDGDGDGLCDAGDQTWFSVLTQQFVNPLVYPQNVYLDPPLGGPISQSFPSFLPASLNLDALDVRGADYLFSVNGNGTVSTAGGNVYLRQNNVYRYNAGFVTTMLDWAAEGVGVGTLDAIDQLDANRFVFSVSATQVVRDGIGVTRYLRPWELYLYDKATTAITVYFNAGVLGIADVDGVDVLKDGRIALSSAGNHFVSLPSGTTYLRRQNVYIYDPAVAPPDLILSYDGGAEGLQSLDGFTLIVPEAP